MSRSRVKKNEEIKRYDMTAEYSPHGQCDYVQEHKDKRGLWCKYSDITLMIEQKEAMKREIESRGRQITQLTKERDEAIKALKIVSGHRERLDDLCVMAGVHGYDQMMDIVDITISTLSKDKETS